MLRPRDIVVLADLLCAGPEWTYREVADRLGIAPSQVHDSVARAGESGLIWVSRRQVVPHAFYEFVVHGLRYAFPATPGADDVEGIETAQSAAPLADRIVSRVAYVWPLSGGHARGRAVEPLDPCVYEAVAGRPAVHELLALIEALRVGGPRERHLAASLLRDQLGLGPAAREARAP